MGSVPVNTGGGGGGGGSSNIGIKELAEQNYHHRYEHREVRDGIVGEGQGLSEEDESKINEVAKDVNVIGREVALLPQASLQKQQQQPAGSVVRWERFLPLRSLKVLLVENDDSTRHVVSALLRNCSYEVIAVSNGVQAWKMLQDLTNHIDLVLTEVVMPCVSGIGLLCKIMSHTTCKNIPVIMMSSHDSMGIVFKCLSKGAVDFLVKPIRKNELKNLWQHVWRRCHCSSGSGSESGIQARKSVKSKSIDESDNNTGSNDEDGNSSVGLNVRDGSDNGSGTQSSWTKRAVEVDSPHPTSPWDQLTGPPDSTCLQVIHPKSESFGTKNECPEHDKQPLDNVAMGKDLVIGVSSNADLQQECTNEKVCTNLIGTTTNTIPELLPEKENKQLDKGPLEFESQNASGERIQAAGYTGLTTNCNLGQVDFGFSETPNSHPKVLESNDLTSSDLKEVPSLELSLKRLRDVSTSDHDDRKMLRRSDASAFSRYHTGHNVNQAPTGIVGSCSPLDNSSEAMKTDSIYNQQSNESSNNYDMGSTNKNAFTKPAAVHEKSASTSTERCLYPSAFQSVQNSHAGAPLQGMPPKVNDVATNTAAAQPRGAHRQVQVQHHHHYYHHHHHHVHNMQQQQGLPDPEDLSLSIGGSAVQCGSSNMVGGPTEGNTGTYSLNGSASGSNHGSSKQNGGTKDVNAGGMNIECDNGLVGKSGVGGSGSGSGSRVDQNRSAQRVAALTKFRQKRKERCFERKVRYQSRKRLAEQRPRVRGQFVRQRVYENTSGEADC
ncbi:Two-component response regulator-like prr73 [Thalictrum thalictroides]|uniref:Two-component response regulator-like prr73 n=1 Tax=Thalictrum thalictroides TaxID=46969 RepID=A0A7J6UTQ9_THATH|nr:Two-component response regulator-like prr73 [Thalictrum thalictroides]